MLSTILANTIQFPKGDWFSFSSLDVPASWSLDLLNAFGNGVLAGPPPPNLKNFNFLRHFQVDTYLEVTDMADMLLGLALHHRQVNNQLEEGGSLTWIHRNRNESNGRSVNISNDANGGISFSPFQFRMLMEKCYQWTGDENSTRFLNLNISTTFNLQKQQITENDPLGIDIFVLFL